MSPKLRPEAPRRQSQRKRIAAALTAALLGVVVAVKVGATVASDCTSSVLKTTGTGGANVNGVYNGATACTPSVGTNSVFTAIWDGDADLYGDSAHICCFEYPTTATPAPGNANTVMQGSYRMESGTGALSSITSFDCDDAENTIYPGATEICDGQINDCNTATLPVNEVDNDGDTYVECYDGSTTWDVVGTQPSVGQDCNDAAAAINPGAVEICDASNTDEDCDGLADDLDSSTLASGKTRYYLDFDEDTFGDSSSSGSLFCDNPTVTCSDGATTNTCYRTTNTDCNDSNSAIKPGATEIVGDGVDQNCDGLETCYDDADNDGYLDTSGDTRVSVDTDCNDTFEGTSTDPTTDCDDNDSSRNPAATEIVGDQIDQNCDSQELCYIDVDGDGHRPNSGTVLSADTDCTDSGEATESAPSGDCDDSNNRTYRGAAFNESSTACMNDDDSDGYGDSTAPSGGSAGTDCADSDATRNPGATETCDSIDNDCDGLIDEGVTTTYYRDADGDGQGTTATGSTNRQSACTPPTGFVLSTGDCNDSDIFTFRGAANNDSTTACMRDADNDGYGSTTAPSGGVAGTDCDDGVVTTHPGATEICDSVDNDCDLTIDEGVRGTYYLDGDGDGYGLTASSTTGCTQPTGYGIYPGDCNDSFADTFPGAAERQSTTTCMTDGDNDGYGSTSPRSGATAGSDCDDAVASTFPGTAQYDSSTACMADDDNDGYGATTAPSGGTAGTDCLDSDSSTNPGATEVCDGVDNDCDGTVDDGVLITWFFDGDGDGYGKAGTGIQQCTQPTGYVRSQTDCDDTQALTHPGIAFNDSSTACMTDLDGDGYGSANPATGVTAGSDCDDNASTGFAIHPGATEACDLVDNDCDGVVDDGVQTSYYRDLDGDGYGNPSVRSLACSQPTNYVTNNSDCDDSSAATRPGIATNDSTTACMTDVDGDGWGSTTPSSATAVAGTDCDDGDPNIRPNATETCDGGVDNDCDGLADDADSPLSGTTTWYQDVDNDSYGNNSVTLARCLQPSGYVSRGNDCDDAVAAANPGASEACDGIDNDCDGATDEGLTTNTWYRDNDEDTYGSASSGASIAQCSDPSASGACSDSNTATICYVTNNSDCNDAAPLINPAAQEVCDSVDNDCDGTIDDADTSVDNSVATGGGIFLYNDADSDGYGNISGTPIQRCNAVANYVADNTDCNDSNSAVNPAEIEICDAADIDENCNGLADDDDSGVDQGTLFTWYADVDEDGYGTSSTGSGTLAFRCNDPSVANGCTDGVTSTACWSSRNTDCNDGATAINPGAIEICDSIDNDCDGLTDANDPSLSGGTTFFRDADTDGYGDAGDSSTECSSSRSGYVLNATDCNDADINTYPGAPEVCDGARNDCNRITSGIPTDEIDLDNDRYVACGFDGTVAWQGTGTINVGEDCEPRDPTSYPTAPEVCDGTFNDCDGRGGTAAAPANETDNDGDGYVECYDGSTTWDVPATLPYTGLDCDDTRASVYPGAPELCDGQFNNCNDTLFGTTSAPPDEQDTDADRYVECSGWSATTWVGASTVLGGDDCDGSDNKVYPLAPEQCDGRFNDCSDPLIAVQIAPDDERDIDGDRYVECNYNSGTWQGLSSILGGNDCDDGDRTVFPSAPEKCDGQYNDCDDPAYDDSSQPEDEYDDDGDYFIECVRFASVTWNPSISALPDPLLKCPVGNPNCFDCDDTDPGTHPPYRAGFGLSPNSYLEAGALASACLTDADGDRYGDIDPADGVRAGTDCDDTLASVYPDAPEVCETGTQIDNDCDGSPNTYRGAPVDENADGAISAYVDGDGDGYGTTDPNEDGSFVVYVVCELGVGFSSNGGDCNDSDPSKHPGAIEVCNEQDDDCDDEVDEAVDLDSTVSGCVDMYRDADEDGYGDYAETLCLCLTGSDGEGAFYRDDRYVTTGGDCDDFNSDTRPLSCRDGRDNDGDNTTDDDDPDCQAGLDEWGDAVEVALEYVDGHDNDCDGRVPAIELDCDDDGSLPLLPIQLSTTATAADVGLADCRQGETRLIECWGEDEIQVVCDLAPNPQDATAPPVGTGLWMLRLDGSDDNWAGRYQGGRRVYTTRACRTAGDCDDQCPSRCPDLDEVCDGLDNDCSNSAVALEGADGDGLPESMVSAEPVAGTVSVDELDVDQDGFLACDSFSTLDLQVQISAASCDKAILDEGLHGDCNNLCSLSNPAAEERCNGFLDLCGGEVEGTDRDADDQRSCGAWSAPLGDEMPEDILLVSWVKATEPGAGTVDSGLPTDSGRRDSGVADTAARDSGDTGNNAVSAGAGDLVPLLLPRTFDMRFDEDGKRIWPPESSALDRLVIECSDHGGDTRLQVYACDELLYDTLAGMVGEDRLGEALCAGDASMLLDACTDGSGTCGIVAIELKSNADDGLWDSYIYHREGECGEATNDAQLIARSTWTRQRILQSREAVVEYECLRIFGRTCALVGDDTPLLDSWTVMVDTSDALGRSQWNELLRFEARAYTAGTVAWCWGDPTSGPDEIGREVGGDCDDADTLTNRDRAEGPGDLLGQLDADGPADCTTCLDGLDNNCDGSIDCADPACAACFVGQGAGCSSASPCEGGGCAVASAPDQKGRSAALVVFLWVAAVLARRRERR